MSKIHIRQWLECWTASDGKTIGCGDTESVACEDLARSLAEQGDLNSISAFLLAGNPDRSVSFELSSSQIFGPGKYLCTISDDAAPEGFCPGTGDDLVSALRDAAGKVKQ